MKLLIDAQRRAPNPRRVRIFLAEKGIEVEYETVDLGEHKHKDDGFAALNPLQRVPVLVLDDGTVITESIAICRYFEELHPEPPLFGSSALEKAVVEMWQRRVELHLFFPVAHAFRHLHPGMKDFEKPQVAEWGEANRPLAQEMMRLLDGVLANRQFIAGDAYTVADITAMVALDFTKVAKIEKPEGLGHLERWYGEVSERPSAKA